MKRIIMGRANDCDIIIPDKLDNVSRHHAVISFDFFGRMKLSDTSSNGTFINGTKMLKGASIPVTTKDEIRLGDNWVFDWSLVEDPYKSARRSSIVAAAVVLVLAIAGITWCIYRTGKSEQAKVEIPTAGDRKSNDWNKDSTLKVAPTVVKTTNSKSKSKSKSKSPNSGTSGTKNHKGKSAEPKISTEKNDKKKVDHAVEMRKGNSSKEKNEGYTPVVN